MVYADGSILQAFSYLRDHGLQGFIDIWPKPTPTACKLIATYAVFEAALQLFLPGKRVEGPISPAGNKPVYKVFFFFFNFLNQLLLNSFIFFLLLSDLFLFCLNKQSSSRI